MVEKLEEFYLNYFHLDNKKEYFELEKDFFRFLLFFLKYEDSSVPTKKIIDKYYKENSKEMYQRMIDNVNNKDVPFIEKKVIDIKIPMISSLEKIRLLDNIFGDEESQKIFGISIKQIVKIMEVILTRVMVFNENISTNKMNETYIEFYGYNPKCYFTKNEIMKYIPKLEEGIIDHFFILFSLKPEEINEEKDIYKIINIDNKYFIYSITNLYNEVFPILQKNIYNYYLLNKINIEDYNIKRGKEFEKIVYEITNKFYSNGRTHLNKYYIYNEKKQETDVLQFFNNSIIYIECKSGNFDIFKIEDDKSLFKKMISTFGSGFKSVKTFYEFCHFDNSKKKIYVNEENFIEVNTNDKKIFTIILSLNDVEYISGNIHFLQYESYNNIDYYPILLNFSDYYSLIFYLSRMNSKAKFNEYLEKRANINNSGKKFNLGCDEIDAFGMICDVRDENNVFNYINNYEKSNNTGELHFNVSNGMYRDSICDELNNLYFNFVIEKQQDSTKKMIKAVYQKN